MGAMAPYFSVYPLPARVPTNAAIVASQHMNWEVTVLDGGAPVEVRMEQFATALAIRPVHGWPPNRALEIVATLGGQERRHPFETGPGPHVTSPVCEWTGPSTIHPKPPMPPSDSWPTNIPRPPKNQRTFTIPTVFSPIGYLVSALVRVIDRGRAWSMVTALPAATEAPAPGQPSPYVALTPGYDDEFSDSAQIIGMTVTDLAGNVARYGTTD
jgi:hypothetical protein